MKREYTQEELNAASELADMATRMMLMAVSMNRERYTPETGRAAVCIMKDAFSVNLPGEESFSEQDWNDLHRQVLERRDRIIAMRKARQS